MPERQGFDVFFGYYHQIHAHYFHPDFLIRSGEKVPLPGNEGFYAGKPGAGFFPRLDPQSGRRREFSQDRVLEEALRFLRYEMPDDDPAVAPYRDRDWPTKARVAAAMVTMYDLADTGEQSDLTTERPDLVQRLAALAMAARTEPRPQIEPVKPAGRSYR